MRNIAIIPARGGSKRIPKKNIKDFCGKPIIAYSIEAALQSELFEEVMVSTDSSEIADIARRYGASVPFMRSKSTSGDYATTEDVLLEVIRQYKDTGIWFDTVCCIYPTAPFVTSGKLTTAYCMMKDHCEADAVVPIVRFSYPPQRGFVKESGFLRYQYPENSMKRSQDLEPLYHDSGQFYVCKTEALENYHDLICPKSIPYEIPAEEAQDIDNYSDWLIAELKFKSMLQKKVDLGKSKR